MQTSHKDGIVRSQGDGFYDKLSQMNNELVNLQRELAKKNAELQKLNDIKNQFLGMAAHDLRKPVGLIMMYSEFLQDEFPGLDKEHSGFLDTIRSASEFMKRIIDDFLDVSMIESGRFELNQDAINLTEVLQRGIDMVALSAKKKEIVIDVEYGNIPKVFADGSKLEQAFTNLLGNAVEYSPSGTSVAVTCQHSGQHITVSISDQGPGIPAEEQEGLFIAFGRGKSKKTGGERSIGLGLAIAHKIIEAHRGRIWVESNSDHGATFIFSLPTVPETEDDEKNK